MMDDRWGKWGWLIDDGDDVDDGGYVRATTYDEVGNM